MRKSSVMLLAALALCAAQAFASNTHTVTFRRMNGTVLSKVEVEHGANATSLVPAGPDESANDLSFSRWDFVDKLACVTNDVTCWALYEATAAKSPSTSIQSKPVVDRGLPYSLDEYFQMYDNLAWSDEFSGTSLDTGRKYSYWGQTYYQGGTWRYIIDHTNNELQQYTEGDNVTLSNGILKITARRETRGDYKFTSAKIATDGCVYVKYGRCEIRAKLTKQQGTWPAFWMIRNDPSHGFYSELDIMEQINGYDWIGGCFHRDIRNSTSEQHKTDSNSGLACTEDGTSWGDEFHRIGAIFNEFEIIWYVDDHIFKRMDVRNRDRYRVYHEHSWYVLLNLAFGGWAGEEYPDGNDDPRIANFLSEDYEIDYCRIYTNTTTDNTVQREAEPAGARLSGPVKATVWRGWQMNWAKPGSNYYMDHLIGREANHIQTALREYFARDKPDVVTFMSKPTEHTDEYDKVMSYDVPGFSSIFLSPEQGANNEPGYFGTTRERLLSGVMYNKERFSTSRSAISSLPISNDADFTNCCAVVAELVENDTGAKVKVVSVNVIRTNGVDNASGVEGQAFSTLMSKLDAMKDEKVILFLQGESWNNLSYIDNRVKTELRPSFSKLGQFTSAWPAYQSAWVTANYSASAENPAPLTLNTSNVYTNQAYCATVQFEAPAQDPVEPDRILYVPVAAGATNTLDAALVTEYITNIVKQGAGTLVASAIPSYSHLITVQGGVWQGGANAGDFGGEGAVIDVLDGASLALRGANGNDLVENALSGKTVNLRGAKCSSALGKVVVSSTANVKIGAATVNLTDSDETLFLDKMGSTSWYFFRLNSGTLNLGGRTLVVSSSGANFETSATIENGGTVDVRNTMFAAETLAPSFTGTGTLKSNGTLNLKLPFSAQGWTVVGSPATLTGNVNRWPTDTSYPGWDGPVSLSGNSKFANYAGATKGVSNTVFNAKGAISGSGTLGVGPGWLNLHSADNTYSGSVTVNGCAPAANQPVLPGGGGIGLWNGAACFPNASSVTFTNTARLAFMDNTACSVPNVKFVALAGETQSVSGGVHAARSTMAGFVKEGAGTLLIDSPVSVTGLADIKAGTLKIAYCSDMSAQTQEAMLEPMPQFASLKFASGTTLDLSDNVGMVLSDLEGAPAVTNSGMFGISGKWTLTTPGEVLVVSSENVQLGGAGGVLCFLPGATFDLADLAAFSNAVANAGADGLLVATASWILDPATTGDVVALPSPVAALGDGWTMVIGKAPGDDTVGRGLYLKRVAASGYAAWISGKGLSGANAAADKVTKGIENAIRYAFDIDPQTADIGTPIIEIGPNQSGNLAVKLRALAEGRGDITYGVLATESLDDWKNATFVPYSEFTDGTLTPAAVKNPAPAQMFFRYKIDIQQ